MEDLQAKQKVLETLTIFNTAIKNIRLYPPTSATIISTIQRLYSSIMDVMDQTTSLTLAESEKNILINDELLPQKDQEKPYIKALSDLLTGFGAKSITFNKELSKEDLGTFIELLSKKPETIKDEGGLQKIMADHHLSHIDLDQKVYVAVDKNHKIISNLDITDDQISQYLMNADFVSLDDLQQLQEKADNPERISRIFHTGLSQIMADAGDSTIREKSDKIVNLMMLVDKVAGRLDVRDQDLLSKDIGKSLAAVGQGITRQLDTQNIEHLFGGMLMEYLAKELSRTDMGEEQTTHTGSPSSGNHSNPNADTPEHQSRAIDLQEALGMLVKEERTPSLNTSLMSVLPKIIDQLFEQKQEETIGIIVDRLIKNMFSEDAEVRFRESEALIDILESLAPGRQMEMIERSSDRLAQWVKDETIAMPTYQKICIKLQSLIDHMIDAGKFEEAIPVLDVFNDISCGILEKNDKIRNNASTVISKLASKDHIQRLYEAFRKNSPDKQVSAGRLLVRLGEKALNFLLDILRDTENSDERVHIMHLVIDFGPTAIPFIKGRINNDEPWYYLRNLAYLMGQIGNEESAAALEPLMRHKDNRLKQEALKSIYRTGGTKRGQMFISALADADDQFKLDIIEAIGNAKCDDIIADLIDILKSRPLVVTSLRSQLEEKICSALGTIGSSAAIPCLSEIADSGSFLRLRAYPEKLKIAAGKALTSIRKKHPKMDAANHS
ncbi:MAG: HEAT repeat domain-containing protein [Deltaproteobacteria bacterium]|nr:HEAT repeat domain-containing protein [Deltaproteobacteria bacterium]